MLKTPLEQSIAEDEGYREHIYRCSEGKLTIGYGYNLEAGMPEDEAHLLMRYRLSKLRDRIEHRLPWFSRISVERQQVLLNMAYQLGFDGLLKFKQMLIACASSDYAKAAVEMMNSKWAMQTPDRAKRLSEKMRNG